MTWAELNELLVAPGLRFTRQSWLAGDLTLILVTVLEDSVLSMDGTMYAPPTGGTFEPPRMDPVGPDLKAIDGKGRMQGFPKDVEPATDWILLHDDAFVAWRKSKREAIRRDRGFL